MAEDVASRRVVGVLLAAGAGSRLGRPKALITDVGGHTWLERAAEALLDGGADPVYVVIGADAESVRPAVPPGCAAVVAAEWAEGMGASLRAGLETVMVHHADAEAVVVMLVDTPGVGADVVRRVGAGAGPGALARATYDGVPGHPVLLGRDHWSGVLEVAHGDSGARDYLRTQHVQLIECSDVGNGSDVDTSAALEAWHLGKRP
ncbi:MAG: nucleotidyltransferase family protein [Nocardioidaceae bacterium]